MKNLVIVESPGKVKNLEKYLGKDYKVMSSYGHVRDLKKKEISVNLEKFTPEYEIPEDKKELVKTLRTNAQKADTVWLASDEDREGEAISWHLAQVLDLDIEKSKRIVFHEITKSAILAAIENPRTIDINLVNAQQARRVLDRIVGFKLSPVLWKKLKPSLSAGRVQSVAVRLIVEREREIESFHPESSFRISALFLIPSVAKDETPVTLKADLNQKFKTEAEAKAFLEQCKGCEFVITEISKKPMKKSPAAPFTTSTLQQDAARKLGFTVSQTMMIAQRLYESGLITYMRTDSVNLSSYCINSTKEAIIAKLGEKYSKVRQYHTNTKGAQEAHEAIRPTEISNREIKGTASERRLYDLIWKRTVASQMADAETEKTTIHIQINNSGALAGESMENFEFTASGEVVVFDGFHRVYRESHDEETEGEENGTMLPPVTEGEVLTCNEISATERFTQHQPRYTEGSLVRRLEELGIGRPSTYAPTISTIQQREYVEKGDKAGEKRKYKILTLAGGTIKTSTKTEVAGAEKSKLLPTDIGTVVNDFLIEHFPDIVDYNFTASVEKDFDEIAEGKNEWQKVLNDFYEKFEPTIESAINTKSEHKAGERILGVDPKSGKPVSVKIGRYGPVVQIGSATDEEKPLFAQMKKGQSIATLTLEEALDLFKLPRTLGDYESAAVTIGVGRFGPYVLHNKSYVSIPKEIDPMEITLDEAVELIEQKRQSEKQRHLKAFDDVPELEIMNGRYGAYICYQGSNYKIPRTITDPKALTSDECMEIIKQQADKKKK